MLFRSLTGFSDDTNRAAAARAGFQHYHLKPIDLGVLDAILRNLGAELAQRATAPRDARRPV